ncbi:MAG TPA: hypothetical protein VEO54_13860 [Thermoanaerobaculia bacterium]|nr:hypothetical protein [Thermoanaerobaculia bacterium]
MRYLPLAVLLLSASLFAQTTNEVVIPRAAAPRLILPVAGNTAGGNGTFFRSDISIINLRNATQRIQIFWFPLGAQGSATPITTLTLPPQQGTLSDSGDFVGEFLQTTGLGGIEFVGVTEQGVFDPAAQLHVTSRIWTPRPDGAPGTMSQTLPVIVAGQTDTADVKAVFGLRRGSQYRLNVGVMNPSNTTQRFRFTIAAAGLVTDTFEIDVPPRSIRQELAPGTSAGYVQVLIEDIGGGAGEWQGWASSVDNQSGDAWSQIAVGG